MVMKPPAFSVIILISVFLLFGCGEKPPTIDGIWKCTPETSIKFPNGTLEPVMMIRDDPGQGLTARGCFLWDGFYHDAWMLVSIHYNDSSKQLTIFDGDDDRFVGQLDEKMDSISGFVYSGDPENTVPMDKLDFVRADEHLASRLFYPRQPRHKGSIAPIYSAPPSMEDGLNTASLLDYTKDTAAFNELMDRIIKQDFGRLESLLIMKDGQLIVEEYFYDYDRTELHNIHSCTKSIASLLLGIAMDQNGEIVLGKPISGFLPGYDSLFTDSKGKITLEHLLTMTSGFMVDDIPGRDEHPDPLRNILSLPLVSEPGEAFQYNNDNSTLLGGILYRMAGMHADQIASQFLFEPLSIETVQWKIINGLPQCHSDLQMLPRDMAKIGHLVLNDGKWENEQVVPSTWVQKSTRPQVVESEFYDYGYHWWHRSAKNKPWWERPDSTSKGENDMVVAMGFGGQYIMIIRELNLVVVTTASDFSSGHLARSKIPLVVEEIIPLLSAF